MRTCRGASVTICAPAPGSIAAPDTGEPVIGRASRVGPPGGVNDPAATPGWTVDPGGVPGPGAPPPRATRLIAATAAGTRATATTVATILPGPATAGVTA